MNAIKEVTLIAIIICLFLATNAYAGKVIAKHDDWRVIELTDWETDSKAYIAMSSDAVIRRAHWPYEGPFQLQYECGMASYLSIFTDGVNLRYGADFVRKKFDNGPANVGSPIEESDNDNYLLLSSTYKEVWKRMIKSNRVRMWLPYHGGDIIVDFSLIGFTAAAKQVARLNGCKHSILVAAGIEKEKRTVGHCDKLVKGFASALNRGYDKAFAFENYKEVRRKYIDKSCSHLGQTLTDLYIKHGVDISE